MAKVKQRIANALKMSLKERLVNSEKQLVLYLLYEPAFSAATVTPKG